MQEAVKKLFDAPWTVYGEPDDYSYVIQNASEDDIATVFMTDEAKRIMHLPELYDALADTVHEMCAQCHFHNKETFYDTIEDMVECGCQMDCQCGFKKVWDLLRKVRDGE